MSDLLREAALLLLRREEAQNVITFRVKVTNDRPAGIARESFERRDQRRCLGHINLHARRHAEPIGRPVDVWYPLELTLKRQRRTQVQQQSAATAPDRIDHIRPEQTC